MYTFQFHDTILFILFFHNPNLYRQGTEIEIISIHVTYKKFI